MTSVRKYTFGEDFDPVRPGRTPPAPPEPPPPPPPPGFTASDLAKARTQGYQEGEKAGRQAGHQAGRAEAEAQIQQKIVQSVQRMADAMTRLISDYAALAEARHREPVAIATALLRKFWPELERRHGLAEIEAMLAACLTDLMEEPKLTVKVHPTLADDIRGRLETAARDRGFEGKLVVIADAATPAGACRVEWANGGALRDSAAILHKIEAAAERIIGRME